MVLGMPRKPLIYTHEHPYHILARSNNKEWFYLPTSDCWMIFSEGLNLIAEKFGFSTHLFVLMNNHYHLIGTCSERHDLGEVMSWLQKAVSRKINHKTGRINHIFGGPYRACLIKDPHHYANVFKYVARNPVEAKMSDCVSSYPYSTLNLRTQANPFLSVRIGEAKEWAVEVDSYRDRESWLDESFPESEYIVIRSALKKTVFRPRVRSTRKDW
ncbi:Transposase IS200 like protein [compost metagenome]